ncbi:hypothetical protein PVAND_003443 [Polypedilum vanderplanki]|uniref:Phospholipid/glycerol acyltransferase domain-containing protein n=1 Tax=Polypedilum vanderplanki TaxID=319348 RepID=A0A9J6BU21_POLVA|nr:hypothetical protein PVAND_003443 [Polypedilum vanderplanki]
MPSECFENIIKYPRAILRVLFVIVNNIYCIPTYLIWMFLLLPLKKLHPDTFYWIEGKFFHWLLANVTMWSYTAGYDIVELGDDITPTLDQRTLVLVNHQSTADVPMLMSTFNTKQEVLPNIMWIMDKIFMYTNFGIVSLIHQDFFIGSGPKQRDLALVQLREHIEKSYIPRRREWMVLFPEGGFLRKRREASQRYAQKNNLPLLHNVTLPRIGAMKTIIDQLGSSDEDRPSQQTTTPPHSIKNINKVINGDGDEFYIDNEYTNQTSTPPDTPLRNAYNVSNNRNNENNNRQTQRIIDDDENLKEKIGEAEVSSRKTLKYIVDITVAYANGKPLDLADIVTGIRKACQTHMLYRVYRCSEVPRDEESLTKWLYDRFVEKEELLENFYNTGSFAYPSEVQPTVVSQDLLRFFLIHLFFITSSYLHFQMLSMLYTAIFPFDT